MRIDGLFDDIYQDSLNNLYNQIFLFRLEIFMPFPTHYVNVHNYIMN